MNLKLLFIHRHVVSIFLLGAGIDNFKMQRSQQPENNFVAYIDGFNLYKGALEKRPDLKWLDLIGLCKDLMPEYELAKVYYFTAPLRNRFTGDKANERQSTYLRVLRHSGVGVVSGHFRKDASWERLVSSAKSEVIRPELESNQGMTQLAIDRAWAAASPDVPKARIWSMKEKGSDVNLASHLLRDVYKGVTHNALVISGDSDLVSAINFAIDEGARVRVCFPNRARMADSLKTVASSHCELRISDIRSNQFANTFIAPNGRQIYKPSEWKVES